MKTKAIVYSVVLMFATSVLPSYGGTDNAEQNEAFEKLSNPDHAVRRNVAREIVSVYDEKVTSLIRIVKERSQTSDFNDPAFLATWILGEIRAVKAVDVLLETIEVSYPTVLSDTPDSVGTAAGDALVKIGKPASLSAVKLIGKVDDTRKRQLLIQVLVRIEGHDVARFMLAKQVSVEPNPRVKTNLQTAIQMMSVAR